MATITKEVIICDICGDETHNFEYYEKLSTPFGEERTKKLVIDTCRYCAKEWRDLEDFHNLLQEEVKPLTSAQLISLNNLREYLDATFREHTTRFESNSLEE